MLHEDGVVHAHQLRPGDALLGSDSVLEDAEALGVARGHATGLVLRRLEERGEALDEPDWVGLAPRAHVGVVEGVGELVHHDARVHQLPGRQVAAQEDVAAGVEHPAAAHGEDLGRVALA